MTHAIASRSQTPSRLNVFSRPLCHFFPVSPRKTSPALQFRVSISAKWPFALYHTHHCTTQAILPLHHPTHSLPFHLTSRSHLRKCVCVLPTHPELLLTANRHHHHYHGRRSPSFFAFASAGQRCVTSHRRRRGAHQVGRGDPESASGASVCLALASVSYKQADAETSLRALPTVLTSVCLVNRI